jgi:ABC-type polysaccharide/polyol phosphate export permease
MIMSPRHARYERLRATACPTASRLLRQKSIPRRNRWIEWIGTGVLDARSGVSSWRIAHLIGISDLRRRYARSSLGQLWIVASTGIMIFTLGVVWSVLWRMPTSELMPHFAIALVLWLLISGTLGEAPAALVTARPIFLNQSMSFSTVIIALLYRQLIIFGHNLVIIALVFLLFSTPIHTQALLAIPGFALLVMNLAWSSYLVAIACTRFRDLGPLVSSILMIAFFVTPVIWQEEQLPPELRWLSVFNPFAALISIVRDPILGKMPIAGAWMVAMVLAIAGTLFTLVMIGKHHRRIIYWI